MTLFEPSARRRRDVRRRRRVQLVRAALVLGVAAFLFGVGVAVGEALHDNPKPGGRQTYTATVILEATQAGVSK